MPKTLPTVRSVIKELGGPVGVAAMFGVSEKAVWNWVSAGRFPSKTYFDVRDALKSKRMSAPEELWRSRPAHSVKSEGAAA